MHVLSNVTNVKDFDIFLAALVVGRHKESGLVSILCSAVEASLAAAQVEPDFHVDIKNNRRSAPGRLGRQTGGTDIFGYHLHSRYMKGCVSGLMAITKWCIR